MTSKKPQVVAEVVDGTVVGVKVAVDDADEVVDVDDSQIVITPRNPPTYDEYQENGQAAIEAITEFIGDSTELDGQLEQEWSKVYDRCKSKGQAVLRALYERGEETEDGLQVTYDEIHDGLRDAGYEVKGKTMPGIIRGINTQIRDYVTGVDSRDEAKNDIMPRVWDEDGNKCRLLVAENDGRRHAEAFQAAMAAKEL